MIDCYYALSSNTVNGVIFLLYWILLSAVKTESTNVTSLQNGTKKTEDLITDKKKSRIGLDSECISGDTVCYIETETCLTILVKLNK